MIFLSLLDHQIEGKKLNITMVMFQLGTIILHTYINLKIKMYKQKHKPATTQTLKAKFHWFEIEIEALENFLLNALIVSIIAEVTFVINKINQMSPIESNLFPNNIYVNVYQLVNPIIVCGIGSLVYFSKHTKMKNFFHREFKDKIIDCNA